MEDTCFSATLILLLFGLKYKVFSLSLAIVSANSHPLYPQSLGLDLVLPPRRIQRRLSPARERTFAYPVRKRLFVLSLAMVQQDLGFDVPCPPVPEFFETLGQRGNTGNACRRALRG
jgi:hypothetical protein